jgi:putative DNA primase/helicase
MIEIVRRELLEAIAARASGAEPTGPAGPQNSDPPRNSSPERNGSGGFKHRLLVERWLQAYGVAYRVKELPDGRGRTVYVLEKCPFDPSHGDPDSCIMQAPDGKMSAQCFHASCSGRGWQAFKGAIGKPGGDHYDPPIAPAAARKKSPAAAVPTSGRPLTDLGNAERLKERHGDNLRHCHPWKRWLCWDRRVWGQDRTAAIITCATETVRSIYAEAARCSDPEERRALIDHASRSEAARSIHAMINLARAQPGIPILPDDMDRDPWSLNVANGTIDLRSGRLRLHRREDLLTKIAPVAYDPAAACPLWECCLGTWMADNSDLTAYLRRVVGYALTGDVSEQVLFFLFGGGSNGKSTFLGIVREMLGDYACQAVSELLMMKKHEAHPTERADLFGRRFVATIETEEGKRMAEALIKQLTGGDNVKARRLYQDFFEMAPTWKIFLAANHKPTIRGTDLAVWRRIRLVPFTVTIPDEQKDKDLMAKLRAEWPGILAWAVRGCLEWQRLGLADPEAVAQATAEYQREQDILAEFIAECCVVANYAAIKSSLLLGAYQEWSGDRDITQQTFRKRLNHKGFFSKRGTGGQHYYQGIGLPAGSAGTHEEISE